MYNIFFRKSNGRFATASVQVASSTFQNIQIKKFSFDSYTKSNFTLNLFLLLLGFLFGNLFPTFFGEFIGKAYIFLLILLESFNYFYYVRSFARVRVQEIRWFTRQSPNEPRTNRPKEERTLEFQNSVNFEGKTTKHAFNCLKIGFLFGLFVDAFKVGS